MDHDLTLSFMIDIPQTEMQRMLAVRMTTILYLPR